MTAPTVDPLARTEVAAADSYQPGDEVWVHRHDAWRPGKVQASGVFGVLVHSRVGDGGRVDTVTAPYVMRRETA